MDLVVPDWKPLAAPSKERLGDPLLQLHWASQIVASLGFAYGKPEPDWSHTNMEWVEPGGLAGTQIGIGEETVRPVLRFSDFALALGDGIGVTAGELPLRGKKLEGGFRWMEEKLNELTGGAASKPLLLPEHELPPHPVGNGEAFTAEGPVLEELAGWYENADRLLRRIEDDAGFVTPSRCWPHHFDIGLLIGFDPDVEPERARFIGIGLAPPDASYDEPYYYVNPYPQPGGFEERPLGGSGRYHKECWKGAVLTGSDLAAAGGAKEQAESAAAFVGSAIRQWRAVLGVRRS